MSCISMMTYKVENNAMLNVKGIYYRCVIWNITRNDAVNTLNIADSNDKGSL